MKKILLLLLALLLVASLAACGQQAPPATTPEAPADATTTPDAPEEPAEPQETPLHVGIVFSTGGLGDQNFNDAAYEGMTRAVNELGITFDFVEPESASDFLPALRTMAETGEYDLIISVGTGQVDALREIGEDFPNQSFTHIDSNPEMPSNVSAQQTRWEDQTFLAGVMAGLGTLSDMEFANADNNTIGVILGMDNPVMQTGVLGFTAGARLVNPEVEVLVGVIGDWGNPGMGREVALSMFHQGADFLLVIGGGSSIGCFNAAAEFGGYAIATGMTVNHLEPDHIVGTAHRSIANMVFYDVLALVNGTWQGGFHISGLIEASVGFDTTGSNVEIPADIQAVIEEVRTLVVDGSITPPANADELEAWVLANQFQG